MHKDIRLTNKQYHPSGTEIKYFIRHMWLGWKNKDCFNISSLVKGMAG